MKEEGEKDEADEEVEDGQEEYSNIRMIRIN